MMNARRVQIITVCATLTFASAASALIYGAVPETDAVATVASAVSSLPSLPSTILPSGTPPSASMPLPGMPTGAAVEAWLTTADQRSLLQAQPLVPIYPSAGSASAIQIDPNVRYQSMEGFGASITDATAYLVQHVLGPAQRSKLLNDLFGATGNRFGMTRVTLGASDFSATHYSYDDLPTGQTDFKLEKFSIAPAEVDVLPTLRAARSLNPELSVMGTPWSPPGWMKTSGSLIGGTLRDDSYHVFGTYLARTAKAYADAGVPLDYLSMQNEPAYAASDYPGMLLSAAQRADLLADYVGPQLAAASPETKILELDHNWDLNPQALQVLSNARAAPYAKGVAWHCYGGDVSQQSIVHNQFPDKETFFTECVGSATALNWGANLGYDMRNLIIGATRNWARGVIYFNAALNTTFGPHKGGCLTCTGVVTVEPLTGTYTKNVQYYSLGHISRYVRRGAVRIFSTESVDNVISVAFVNPDNTLVLIAFNQDSVDHDTVVTSPAGSFKFHLPAGAAVTFRWNNR